MTRPRDPRQPLPRDPDVRREREFLYPYRILADGDAPIALAEATLQEFAEVFRWNLSDDPQTGVINAVQIQCEREHDAALRHLVRLLCVGTLGVAPHRVGDAIAWHAGYVAMHDGDPLPEPHLRDYFAFWSGDQPGSLGGVCEQSGLLCWWEVTVGPGWARDDGYFLQECSDFLSGGAPERVNRIWIDTAVEAELRPLVAQQVGDG